MMVDTELCGGIAQRQPLAILLGGPVAVDAAYTDRLKEVDSHFEEDAVIPQKGLYSQREELSGASRVVLCTGTPS
jgi:hypothetical protein